MDCYIPPDHSGVVRFLAAVSGGADSMAMLSALCAVKRDVPLYCLHVEHGLRSAEESLGDAEAVRAFCEKNKIECKIARIPPGKISDLARRKGLGIEAAARFFRHRALSKEAARLGGNTVILLAHTKDDLLETALMRVLRGCGPAGLSAMPVKRGRILRPLLSMTRADVLAYLKAKEIAWREDSTNADEKFLRNRIRRRLIPLLDESFPSWKTALFGMAQTQSLTADFLAKEAQQRVKWESRKDFSQKNLSPNKKALFNEDNSDKNFAPFAPLRLRERKIEKFLSTDAENFFAQPEIIREEALFSAIDRLLISKSSVPVKRSVLRRFCSGAVTSADLGTVSVRRKGGEILLSRVRRDCSETGFSLLIKETGLYNLKKISIEISPLSAQEKESGFFAVLPLVFRRCFKDDFLYSKGRKITGRGLAKSTISAVDSFGTAAFIGPDGVVSADAEKQNCELFFVKVTTNGVGRNYV
jgi:tRNA(Ile)-lysidine synthase